jgi:hypothetical protein
VGFKCEGAGSAEAQTIFGESWAKIGSVVARFLMDKFWIAIHLPKGIINLTSK